MPDMRSIIRILPLLAAAMSGCAGSGSRSVTLEVTSHATDGTPQPVTSAFVRAIPMASSPVPLPINSRTLQELGNLKKDADFTDTQGRVTLTIASVRPFIIEVANPFTATDSLGEVWRGDFDPESGDLTAQPTDSKLNVRIVQ